MKNSNRDIDSDSADEWWDAEQASMAQEKKDANANLGALYAGLVQTIAEKRDVDPSTAISLSTALLARLDARDHNLPSLLQAYICDCRMHAFATLCDEPGTLQAASDMLSTLEDGTAYESDPEKAQDMMDRGIAVIEAYAGSPKGGSGMESDLVSEAASGSIEGRTWSRY